VCGLKCILSFIGSISKWTGRIVSYLVVIMMVILVYEVTLRYVFNNPTNWVHELAGFLFGSYFLLLGGYALYAEIHISMDLLYKRWSPRTQAIVGVVTYPLSLLFLGILFYFGGEWAWESVMSFEHSRSAWNPPIYPFKVMVPLAALLYLLQGVARFIRDLNMAIRGKEL